MGYAVWSRERRAHARRAEHELGRGLDPPRHPLCGLRRRRFSVQCGCHAWVLTNPPELSDSGRVGFGRMRAKGQRDRPRWWHGRGGRRVVRPGPLRDRGRRGLLPRASVQPGMHNELPASVLLDRLRWPRGLSREGVLPGALPVFSRVMRRPVRARGHDPCLPCRRRLRRRHQVLPGEPTRPGFQFVYRRLLSPLPPRDEAHRRAHQGPSGVRGAALRVNVATGRRSINAPEAAAAGSDRDSCGLAHEPAPTVSGNGALGKLANPGGAAGEVPGTRRAGCQNSSSKSINISHEAKSPTV